MPQVNLDELSVACRLFVSKKSFSDQILEAETLSDPSNSGLVLRISVADESNGIHDYDNFKLTKEILAELRMRATQELIKHVAQIQKITSAFTPADVTKEPT